MLTLLTLDQRVTLVCSADEAVSLKLKTLDDQEKSKGKAKGKAPAKPTEDPRLPIRWLPASEVESANGALKITVRPLNSDEQHQVTGGLLNLTGDRLTRAYVEAAKLAVTGAQGPGVDALTPEEVQSVIARIPLKYLEPLGDWILNRSCGFGDPFGAAA